MTDFVLDVLLTVGIIVTVLGGLWGGACTADVVVRWWLGRKRGKQ